MGKEEASEYTKKGYLRCRNCGTLYRRYRTRRYKVWHDDEGFDKVEDVTLTARLQKIPGHGITSPGIGWVD